MSAHAQCKQTAAAEINEFTGWAIIILEYHMNKIVHIRPWYHGTAHPPEADQLRTQRGYINVVHGYLEMFWKPILLSLIDTFQVKQHSWTTNKEEACKELIIMYSLIRLRL